MPTQNNFESVNSAVVVAGGQRHPRRRTKAARRAGRNYFKSRDFPIHLLLYWWILWLVLAYTDLNEFIPPSWQTLAQYAMLLISFLIGHWLVRYRKELRLGAARRVTMASAADSSRMRFALAGSALLCAAMLLLSLWLSGALTENFLAYFAKLRTGEDEIDLTGSHSLDILTRVFDFPLAYTVILVVLASDARRYKGTLLLCIGSLLAFSYLWQVNYPLIHLFWLLVFYWLIQARLRGAFDSKVAVTMLVLFVALLASAANRFGGDSFASDVASVVERYFVGYHLIGFSFYDHQYLDPNSILHAHTFGRSSLGFVDRVLQAFSNMVGGDYQAASLQNTDYNSEAVDIGLGEIRQFNAFGTLLFGLYRDFHLFGIALGGFVYGAFTTLALHRSKHHWFYGALFLLLASSWMMGMMVNPIEQPYFWFAVIALTIFSTLGRRVKAAVTAASKRSSAAPSS